MRPTTACSSAASWQSGFSLVETLVACLLLTVGVVSLLQVFVLASSANALAMRAMYTSIFAAEKA